MQKSNKPLNDGAMNLWERPFLNPPSSEWTSHKFPSPLVMKFPHPLPTHFLPTIQGLLPKWTMQSPPRFPAQVQRVLSTFTVMPCNRRVWSTVARNLNYLCWYLGGWCSSWSATPQVPNPGLVALQSYSHIMNSKCLIALLPAFKSHTVSNCDKLG